MPPPTETKPQTGIVRFFLRGVITLLPVLLTLIVFGLAFQMVNTYVTGPINSVIYWSLEGNALGWKALRKFGIDPYDKDYLDPSLLPLVLQDVARNAEGGYSDPRFDRALADHRDSRESFFRDLEGLCVNEDRLRGDVQDVVHPVVGVVASLLVVLSLGWLVGGFVGRRLVTRLDHAMHVIPIVKSVYPYSKQLVEFFFAERSLDFDTVVAVPYPSPGLWSIGFVTKSHMRTLVHSTGKQLVSVFVPSSPMPMTGYTIFVEQTRLIPLPMTVDEALRITISGGVLLPPHEQMAAGTFDFETFRDDDERVEPEREREEDVG